MSRKPRARRAAAPPVAAPQKTPPIGSIWRHHKGGLYLVYDVTNTLRGNVKFPVRVVYLDTQGNTFSRDLEAWSERYSPADGLNEYERQQLAQAALDIQAMKDRVQREFLEVLQAMRRRSDHP